MLSLLAIAGWIAIGLYDDKSVGNQLLKSELTINSAFFRPSHWQISIVDTATRRNKMSRRQQPDSWESKIITITNLWSNTPFSGRFSGFIDDLMLFYVKKPRQSPSQFFSDKTNFLPQSSYFNGSEGQLEASLQGPSLTIGPVCAESGENQKKPGLASNCTNGTEIKMR